MLWPCFLCFAAFIAASETQGRDAKFEISVAEHERSLHVSWKDYNVPKDMESVRLRVDPCTEDDDPAKASPFRQIFFSPASAKEITILGLEPDSRYKLQLMIHFTNDNDTEAREKSKIKYTRTKADYWYVALKEQYKFVLIGAGLAMGLMTIVSVFACCCCCSCRRRGQMSIDRNDSGKKCGLPSKDYLDSQHKPETQDRYVPYEKRTVPRPPSTPSDPAPPPPPFWKAVQARFNRERKRSESDDEFQSGGDSDAYQNEVFSAVRQDEAPPYGNVQF